MELEYARVGTPLRVDLDYRKAHLQGLVGAIKKRYGDLTTQRLRFCSPRGGRSCSGTTSWRRQRSHPLCPSGGGSSGSNQQQSSETQGNEDMQVVNYVGKVASRTFSISEVALSCGFADHSRLRRHFKRLVGLTPKAFRRASSSSRKQ
jgi:AraC-like DNA-binding protein